MFGRTFSLLLTSVIFAAGAQSAERDLACARALKASALTPIAVLDFDGDGFSDIVSSRGLESATEFSIIRSSDGVEIIDSVSKGFPVPGDYDGDGKWDLATVTSTESGLVWTIKRSTTGVLTTKRFGTRKSKVVAGCRLGITPATSLAYSVDGKVFASQIDSDEVVRIGFSKLPGGVLVGCGDITNDGSDDLIVKAPSPNRRLDELATVGCSNEILVYRNVRPFQSGGVVNRNGLEFPFLIALRRADASSKHVVLEAIAEVVDYPRYSVPEKTIFSSGYFKSGTEGSYGILRQGKNSREVFRRLLENNDTTETLAVTLSADRELVAPQKVEAVR